MASEQTAEAGRIQGCTRAQHAPGRHATESRKPRGQVRHHVNRVGGDDEHRVGCVRQHCRHHFAEDVRVALEKLQSSLSGLLPDAGAEHDNSTFGQSLVATGPDLKRMRKWHGVANVVRLRRGSGCVLVHQHDLAPDSLHHERVPGGGADESAADNADFHRTLLSVVELPVDARALRLARLCPDGQRPRWPGALARDRPGIRDGSVAGGHPVHTSAVCRSGCSGSRSRRR